jgi:hypothetical protein
MCEGSKNHRNKYLDPFEKIGAKDRPERDHHWDSPAIDTMFD